MSLFNLLTAPRLSSKAGGELQHSATLSVLIPVRNEKANLLETLPALRRAFDRMDFLESQCEIVFLDDGSTDSSDEAIRRAGFKVIPGKPLPAGWTGKNWACHQLSLQATKTHLLFMDADVKPGPEALRDTLRQFKSGKLSALTALPGQRMGSLSEFLVIPWVMHLSILGSLPLALASRFGFESQALGNGQWIAFSRKTYERIGGHAAVKASWLEDMQMARLAVRSGGVLQVFLGASELEVRMYRDSEQLRQGFGKNLYLLTGQSLLASASLGVLILSAGWSPFFLLALGKIELALISLAAVGIWRAAAARAFGLGLGHFLGQWFLGHALGSLAVVRLLFLSVLDHRLKRARWKGRALP